MRRPIPLLLASCLTVALALGGCSSADTPEDTAMPDAGETTLDSFDWLTGTWTVTTELTAIDNPVMTEAADQPGAQWECSVDGETMTLGTDQHEYTGTLMWSGGNTWIYDASATFVDEDGAEWTSDITVTATRDTKDMFSGVMEGTISSAVEGPLYTATWDLQAQRQ